MMKASYNPIGCHFVQLRIAMATALDLISQEMMSWPEEERPVRVHSLESTGHSLRVHFATATREGEERPVTAYTPIVWHELAMVRDRKSDFRHHKPLVQALNARISTAAERA